VEGYLRSKEAEVFKLAARVEELGKVEKAPPGLTTKIQELEEELRKLREENESLIVQRKTLIKTKESAVKDLEKIKKEEDAKEQEHL